MACKRKYWSQQAMEQAVASVKSDAMGLREAARCYNVPVETLRRRVKGLVPVECKQDPPTVLSKEEDQLYEYLINMADMGYGITRDTLMRLAF
uniref:HTH psq-type domain-containing protein n=1 Tax=Amphimedon queenslandica TaxID=400682 RepID=A0A1X7TL34_AMPQE